MGKTTNILDLNNRLTKVEKEKIAQNNYNSLQNRPKINGNLLTGNKTGTQLGLAEAQDIGDLSALTTTDKSSVVAGINEVKSGLTNMATLLQITQLSDTATQYQLQGNYSDYMFVAIILGWYNGTSNDNMFVIPANNWLTNDYLMLYRNNDPSTQAYARIENRGNGSITALGTEGVSVSVLGFIHK